MSARRRATPNRRPTPRLRMSSPANARWPTTAARTSQERGGSYFFKFSFSPPQLVNAADCAEGARLLAGTPGGNGNGAINGKSRTEL